MSRSYGRLPDGRELTEELADELAEKTSAQLDAMPPEELAERTVRIGRPPSGDGPGSVVVVRLDRRLREALDTVAAKEEKTRSEIVREALTNYLLVPRLRRP